MDATAATPWFSHHGQAFTGSEPFFYDTRAFPWVERIESQWSVIRDELMALVDEDDGGSLLPYPNPTLVSKPDRWKIFGFMFWTIKFKKNCAKCPRTWKLLASIPNVTSGSFNLLEPNATIKPHYGDTNAIIRCHLGLVIPAPAPACAFKVGSEIRSWKEGEVLMFCDAHMHTAWNNTNQRRFIMIIDIIRPEYAARQRSICRDVLASIETAIVYERKAWLRKHFNAARGKAVVLALYKAFYQIILSLRMDLQTVVRS